MTTIAWDGKTLAADRRATWGGTPVVVTKAARIKAPDGLWWLVGTSGHSAQCEAAMRWMAGRAGKPDDLNDCSRIAVSPRGDVWHATGVLWSLIGRRAWAIGSGSDYALGAMAAGATAKQAVRIAARLDVSTGNGVQTLTHYRK